MSKSQKPNDQNRNNNQPYSEDLIKAFFDNTSKEIELKRAETALEDKKIQSHEKLALKAMELQSADIKSRPSEFRKNIITIASITVMIIIIIATFIGYLLHNGHQEVAWGIIKIASYAASVMLGFFTGRKSKRNKHDFNRNEDIEDPSYVENE